MVVSHRRAASSTWHARHASRCAPQVGVLWIKKRFVTALHVTHCHESLKTTFRLAKPGMMTDFQGHWALSPLDADSYEALVPHHLVSPARDPERQTTLLYLEQDVAPALTQKVPPMMHGLLRRISKTAVVSLIQVRRAPRSRQALRLPQWSPVPSSRCHAAPRVQGLHVHECLTHCAVLQLQQCFWRLRNCTHARRMSTRLRNCAWKAFHSRPSCRVGCTAGAAWRRVTSSTAGLTASLRPRLRRTRILSQPSRLEQPWQRPCQFLPHRQAKEQQQSAMGK